MKTKIESAPDLEVYRRAFAAAMQVFKLSKAFPKEERYSLTDQARRASRSVAANISEGWRKRRYAASFVSKLNAAQVDSTNTLPQSMLRCERECERERQHAALQL
jgi:four helix bundle protein